MLYFPPNELGKWSRFDGCIYFSSVLVQPPTIVCKLVEIHPAIPRSFFLTMDIFRFFREISKKRCHQRGSLRGSDDPGTLVFLKACHFLLKGWGFLMGKWQLNMVFTMYMYTLCLYINLWYTYIWKHYFQCLFINIAQALTPESIKPLISVQFFSWKDQW